MPKVKSLVFRRLTDADFFNINKPSGVEKKGGGQSYIDLSTSAVTIANWREFFKGIPEKRGINGPGWKFPTRSLGTTKGPQEITTAQRRHSSVSIRSQKLLSQDSQRVYAWHPDLTGFPRPANPKVRSHIYNLVIYIVRLDNGEYWAGWFQKSQPEANWPINQDLNRMFTENEGYITFKGDVDFDTTDAIWPFKITGAAASTPEPTVPTHERGEEDEEEKVFFDKDEVATENATPAFKETIRKIRVRNTKAVKKLKKLYGNLCQVTGAEFTFRKENGEYYSEAHHLIALGKGGSDSVHNIVVVSPLIHRMFHNAKVEGLDLTKIKDNKLPFKINGEDYVITYHPEHAKIVEEANLSSDVDKTGTP